MVGRVEDRRCFEIDDLFARSNAFIAKLTPCYGFAASMRLTTNAASGSKVGGMESAEQSENADDSENSPIIHPVNGLDD